MACCHTMGEVCIECYQAVVNSLNKKTLENRDLNEENEKLKQALKDVLNSVGAVCMTDGNFFSRDEWLEIAGKIKDVLYPNWREQ